MSKQRKVVLYGCQFNNNYTLYQWKAMLEYLGFKVRIEY